MNACHQCDGLGLRFVELSEEQGLNLPCPFCGGTGRYTSTLRRRLTGQANRSLAKQNASILFRFGKYREHSVWFYDE